MFNAEWKDRNPFSAQFFALTVDSYLTEFDRLWRLSKPETDARISVFHRTEGERISSCMDIRFLVCLTHYIRTLYPEEIVLQEMIGLQDAGRESAPEEANFFNTYGIGEFDQLSHVRQVSSFGQHGSTYEIYWLLGGAERSPQALDEMEKFLYE